MPALYAAGAPVPPPPAIELLHQRAYDRGIAAKRRLAQRLAAAEQAPGVLSVLAAHFAAQRIDNKWESEALAMELEDAVQDALGRAAAGPTPDALTVQAAEALARVLGEKRRVDALYPTLGPAAERHAPWPALEVALAQADLELLDPAAAVERLEPLLAGRGGSAAAWAMLAEGQQQLGHDEDAARSLERALALAPGNEELERRLAVAAVRAGRPDGPQRLARALDEAPQSEELLRYRGAGPWGPPRQGYHPLSRGEHGH
ncbi:MAG: hypothetical protein H6828_16600 [Planctomycetes bacterium]|nr:hypothetical protein [Planctomycetota bacterium]